ncbi:unnamed protein product [Lupinus luteus]|uniref:Uncharacterized protein n=1 Tax=Lupinus luteus TaxID=3873 RepID=A0AAV1W667_LUPLU
MGLNSSDTRVIGDMMVAEKVILFIDGGTRLHRGCYSAKYDLQVLPRTHVSALCIFLAC